jgi:hypothetical protein
MQGDRLAEAPAESLPMLAPCSFPLLVVFPLQTRSSLAQVAEPSPQDAQL